ncbi:calcium-binding protein [Phyllobacterium endophyticum]|uniref:calcium-binding protein n=1 Tax=Phyllobacterium endophyticum TaxID=1149773 RepID=UPI0011E7A5F9|nr:calcium-binding protein [Phyllobacterium endophyticum]TYR39352.1 calcium-binding protein [Phyllobacterium endophyticum]
MPFFKDEVQYQKASLGWKLVLLSEGSYRDQKSVDKTIDEYGTGAFGGLVNEKGKFHLTEESGMKGWKQIGGPAPVFFTDKNGDKQNDAYTKDIRLAILQALGITADSFKDGTYLGDDGKPITDLTQLIDSHGFFRGFNVEYDANDKPTGKYSISPDGGAQVQVLAQYDDKGNIISLAITALGTNGALDFPEKDAEANLTMARKFGYILSAVEKTARANGIEGKDIMFAGYSLGGGIISSFHRLKTGFFKDSFYFAGAPGAISPEERDGRIFSIGAENDPVYGLWDHGTPEGYDDFRRLFKNGMPDTSKLGWTDLFENLGPLFFTLSKIVVQIVKREDTSKFLTGLLTDKNFQHLVTKVFNKGRDPSKFIKPDTFKSFITHYIGVFDNFRPYVASGPNNLVVFDDAYHQQNGLLGASEWIANLLNMQLNNKTVASSGWATHGSMPMSDAVDRIYGSVFHDVMDRDSVIVLSHLTSKLQGKIWVEDKKTPTSDHYGAAAFILGTNDNDLIRGGRGDDAIETLSGNDYIDLSSAAGLEHSKGTDIVYAGQDNDTVILDGYREDYVFLGDKKSRTLYVYNPATGLKELHDVENLQFRGARWWGEAVVNWFSGLWGGTKHEGTFNVDVKSGQLSRYESWQFLFWHGGEVKNYGFNGHGGPNGGNNNANHLLGTDGDDTIRSLNGNDLIIGGKGNDTLMGDHGNDAVYGGEGNDQLYGGIGNDVLHGGFGNDRFYYEGTGFGIDTIGDFNTNANDRDVLTIDRSLFGNLGELLANAKWCGEGTISLVNNNSGVKLQGWASLDQFRAYANSHSEAFSFA